MSPLVEMLTLLNRSWKVRFLMRSRILTLGRTVFFARGTPLRGKVWGGADAQNVVFWWTGRPRTTSRGSWAPWSMVSKTR